MVEYLTGERSPQFKSGCPLFLVLLGVLKYDLEGLVYTKHTCSYFSRYLHFYIWYWSFTAIFGKFSMPFCLSDENFNWIVHLHKKLLKPKNICAHISPVFCFITFVYTNCIHLQIDKFNISHYSSFDMSQFSDYSCVSNQPDVEKLLHAHLLPIITPAPGNMLVSGDCESQKRDPMLAIAMEITSDPIKNTKVHIICMCVDWLCYIGVKW